MRQISIKPGHSNVGIDELHKLQGVVKVEIGLVRIDEINRIDRPAISTGPVNATDIAFTANNNSRPLYQRGIMRTYDSAGTINRKIPFNAVFCFKMRISVNVTAHFANNVTGASTRLRGV